MKSVRVVQTGKMAIGPIVCSECKKEIEKSCKGKCYNCYNRLRKREQAEKRKQYDIF